uniref:F-box and WD repeat domain containing 5 n=1 Tax=Oncorhynchus tshawytscha TaxID=74940 RepID=A0AAZ3QZ75_ONCTS
PWYPIVLVATILSHRYNSRTGSGETKVESHASVKVCTVKDCTVKLWDTERPDGTITMVHSSSMLHFNWGYTQFSQFNTDDTLLLATISVGAGSHSSSGEIAVICLENYTLLSCVRNKPYDVFGCWLNETHLVSGNLHWIGNMTSCSVLWLNKAFQNYRISLVSLILVSLNKVLVYVSSLSSSYQLPKGVRMLVMFWSSVRFFSSVCAHTKNIVRQKSTPFHWSSVEILQFSVSNHILFVTCAEYNRCCISPYSEMLTYEPLTNNAGEDKTYLLFTTGSLTYFPHQIGIKRIMPDQMIMSGPVLGEESSTDKFFDSLDHVIGMGLSPDHRYLYVNSRAWLAGWVISDPMSPHPIAEEIDLHVIDLNTFTPNEECFFIFLDVSRDFVASGAEDKHGYIWDHHHNICLARLQHDVVVNSVAFSPTDLEQLLSASDDSTIKVWHSARPPGTDARPSPAPSPG